jgi:hypothetical protein
MYRVVEDLLSNKIRTRVGWLLKVAQNLSHIDMLVSDDTSVAAPFVVIICSI